MHLETDVFLETDGRRASAQYFETDEPKIKLSKKKITYSKLVFCNSLRYVTGAFLIALQITASIIVLIVNDPPLRPHFPYHVAFPGIVNGVNVILYAMRYQITLKLVKKMADAAVEVAVSKEGPTPEHILWDGLPFRRWVRFWIVVISLLSIGLAIAFVVFNALCMNLAIALSREGQFPIIAEVMVFLHIALQLCGFISMNTFVEGVKTHFQLSRGCCAFCYPLPMYIAPKKKGKPLILLKD